MAKKVLWALVVSLVLVAVASQAIASSGYAITVDDSLDTPTRTVTLGGDDFTVSAVAIAEPGGKVSTEVTVPHSDRYRVLIYNADVQTVDQKPATGDASVDFDLPNPPFEPGTYAITVSYDGSFQVIHPLVVEGYDVSFDAPSEKAVGDTLEVTVQVTETTPSKDYETVEFAIVNDTETVRREASEEQDGTYTTSIKLDNLDPGQYRMYAAVRGNKTVFGKKERLGLSEQRTLKITSQATENDTESGSEEGEQAGGASGIGRVSTSTPPPTPPPTKTVRTPTSTVDATPMGSTPTRGLGTEAGQETDRPSEPGSTEGSQSTSRATTPTDDEVITPAPSTGDRTQGGATESPGQDGFGLAIGIGAILAIALLAARRT